MNAMPDTPAGFDGAQLLLGDEEFLLARAVTDAASAAKARYPDCEVTEIAMSETTPGSWSQLLSPSLFGEHRVVVVRRAHEAAKDTAQALLTWVAQLPPNLLLLVEHAGGARNKALADGLKSAGAQVVLCAKLKSYRDRQAFVRAEIRRFGGKPDAVSQRHGEDDIADLILTSVGSNLRELSAACQQLVTDTGGTVGAADVRRYYQGRAEVTGFTVAEAVMMGDAAAALESLRWAISVGVDPVLVADALADGVRSVAKVSSAGRGNPYQLASSLGMPPWKVERVQRQARGWSPDALALAAHHAAQVNGAVKGGGEDRVYALERAVMAMIDVRGEHG
jgi:DNA polymerase-3 subunit delta